MNTEAYSQGFFAGVESTARPSAEVIVPLALELTGAKSVVDFGCGTGQWLVVFCESGLIDFLGLDGPWVDATQLKVPREQFQVADLTRPVRLARRFDLAISLEVAEHLPESSASDFVDSLVRASDLVLFSAGVPSQGGCNHLNEQWPDFWIELFRKHGYSAHDCLRKQIWTNTSVSPWYAQNVFLFARDSVLAANPALALRIQAEGLGQIRVVHPRLFEDNMHLMAVRADPVNLPFSTLLLSLPRKAYHAVRKRLS